MENKIHKYQIKILDEIFLIVSDENQDFVLKSFKEIENLTNNISNDYKTKDIKKVIILALIKLTFEKFNSDMILNEEKLKFKKIIDFLDFNLMI